MGILKVARFMFYFIPLVIWEAGAERIRREDSAKYIILPSPVTQPMTIDTTLGAPVKFNCTKNSIASYPSWYINDTIFGLQLGHLGLISYTSVVNSVVYAFITIPSKQTFHLTTVKCGGLIDGQYSLSVKVAFLSAPPERSNCTVSFVPCALLTCFSWAECFESRAYVDHYLVNVTIIKTNGALLNESNYATKETSISLAGYDRVVHLLIVPVNAVGHGKALDWSVNITSQLTNPDGQATQSSALGSSTAGSGSISGLPNFVSNASTGPVHCVRMIMAIITLGTILFNLVDLQKVNWSL